MNVQPKAIDLYVALAAIGKVHGLTPHSILFIYFIYLLQLYYVTTYTLYI